MDLNNIKRNQLDYILTDVLPVELSDRFTYKYFYEYLATHSKEIEQMLEKMVENKNKKNAGTLFKAGGNWVTVPLKYSIMKSMHSVREISLVQPMAAIEMLLFVGIYQKELLTLLEKNAIFSLRFHRRNNDLIYKNKNKSVTKYFAEESKDVGREIIEQTGMFFNIGPYKSIAAFTSSEEWLVLNSKYKYFVRTDYKACFDSIYTHTFKWLIGKDVNDTKDFDNTNIYTSIDRILQNINARTSNGIVVGPEFSRMIAELLLQAIDTGVYNKLLNMGQVSGENYNVYRFVDDIFIFSESEELANRIIELYSELARKYLLRLNESKLYKSKVPFVLEGWLNEANMFSNRICDVLMTTKEEQNNFVAQKAAKEEIVKPYLIKSHVIRYGSKAKQSIMNQLNELICEYEEKDRTIVAYFLGTIFNKLAKNKDKYTIFAPNVSEMTVISFLDLMFYAYSFFPNYNNTQKFLSIISYVRDEYDILSCKEKLQQLFNKYSFVFEKGNLNDIVNLILFCAQAGIEIPFVQEERIEAGLMEKDDPILWGSYLLYAKYNKKYFEKIRLTIQNTIIERIDAIRKKEKVYTYREFWWIIIFNKCPYIDLATQAEIDRLISGLVVSTAADKTPRDLCGNLFVDYLKNNLIQFFEWDMSQKDFLRNITFKTYERSIFKNYKENIVSLNWGSI